MTMNYSYLNPLPIPHPVSTHPLIVDWGCYSVTFKFKIKLRISITITPFFYLDFMVSAVPELLSLRLIFYNFTVHLTIVLGFMPFVNLFFNHALLLFFLKYDICI